jgi:hypothetical protein
VKTFNRLPISEVYTMNDSEDRTRQMFLRVQNFGLVHGGDFAPNSLWKELNTNLDGVITELNTLAAAEVSGFGTAFHGTRT